MEILGNKGRCRLYKALNKVDELQDTNQELKEDIDYTQKENDRLKKKVEVNKEHIYDLEFDVGQLKK